MNIQVIYRNRCGANKSLDILFDHRNEGEIKKF